MVYDLMFCRCVGDWLIFTTLAVNKKLFACKARQAAFYISNQK